MLEWLQTGPTYLQADRFNNANIDMVIEDCFSEEESEQVKEQADWFKNSSIEMIEDAMFGSDSSDGPHLEIQDL